MLAPNSILPPADRLTTLDDLYRRLLAEPPKPPDPPAKPPAPPHKETAAGDEPAAVEGGR